MDAEKFLNDELIPRINESDSFIRIKTSIKMNNDVPIEENVGNYIMEFTDKKFSFNRVYVRIDFSEIPDSVVTMKVEHTVERVYPVAIGLKYNENGSVGFNVLPQIDKLENLSKGRKMRLDLKMIKGKYSDRLSEYFNQALKYRLIAPSFARYEPPSSGKKLGRAIANLTLGAVTRPIAHAIIGGDKLIVGREWPLLIKPHPSNPSIVVIEVNIYYEDFFLIRSNLQMIEETIKSYKKFLKERKIPKIYEIDPYLAGIGAFLCRKCESITLPHSIIRKKQGSPSVECRIINTKCPNCSNKNEYWLENEYLDILSEIFWICPWDLTPYEVINEVPDVKKNIINLDMKCPTCAGIIKKTISNKDYDRIKNGQGKKNPYLELIPGIKIITYKTS
ncbi:MAG: hypothetical protein EAX96_12620 [Candidatus Lokiarchaeota archaeon]|nr:hypothetical protein [Candidatus Lokiarchaeota archaeon]